MIQNSRITHIANEGRSDLHDGTNSQTAKEFSHTSHSYGRSLREMPVNSSARPSASSSSHQPSSSSSSPSSSRHPSATNSAGVSQRLSSLGRQSQSLQRQSNGSSTNAHHPYRIEVQDVSPVSISLRWSLRPPPISQLASVLSAGSSKRESQESTQNRSAAARSDGRQENRDEDDAEDEDDDDATAVDETSDREDPPSEDHGNPPLGTNGDASKSTTESYGKIFGSGLSVHVDGAPWSQVVMGEQGLDESLVIVYGLLPDREYLVELTVGTSSDKVPTTLSTRLSTGTVAPAAEADSSSVVTSSAHGRDDNGANAPATRQTAGVLAVEHSRSSAATANDAACEDRSRQDRTASAQEAAEARRSALLSELRQTRKESSRAEQSLRNEIEAIKRSIDRMSSVDHRSKQKVLALQESIRQAGQSARDTVEHADEIESNQPRWENDAKRLATEEENIKQTTEAAENEVASKIKESEERTASAEKELSAVQKALTTKIAEGDKLEEGRVAELQQKLAALQAEAHRIENAATPPPQQLQTSHYWQRGAALEPHAAPFHPMNHNASGSRSVSGPPVGSRGQRQGPSRSGASITGPGPLGKAGPRNASGQHSHRRGRGGGSAGSTVPHVFPQQMPSALPYGHSSPLGQPPMAHALDMSGPQANSNYGNHALSGASTLSPFPSAHVPLAGTGSTSDALYTQGTASPFTTSSILNPASSDFIPSAHQSPLVSKSYNVSPIPPSLPPTGFSSGSWAPTLPTSGSSDFASTMTANAPGVRPNFGRMGLASGPNSASHGSSESPTLSNAMHFAGPGLRRDSPTSVVPGPSPFASSNTIPALPMNSGPMYEDAPRTSYGPLDYIDDSVFDPTAPAQHIPQTQHMPAGSGAYGGGVSRPPGAVASPWGRAFEDAPGQATDPWSSSSPVLGGGSGIAQDDIWSNGGGSASVRALRSHPSLFAGSASLFDVPPRNGSGSAGSSHSIGAGSGQGSTPTSPTVGQRAGSFGAIGGGKAASTAATSSLTSPLMEANAGSRAHEASGAGPVGSKPQV